MQPGTYSTDMEKIMKKQAKKKTRACPRINGERTSFVELGKALSCDRERAAEVYKSITGKVTWVKLFRADHNLTLAKRVEREKMARRDARIVRLRSQGVELKDIVAKLGNSITVQRAQQIAGTLQ